MPSITECNEFAPNGEVQSVHELNPIPTAESDPQAALLNYEEARLATKQAEAAYREAKGEVYRITKEYAEVLAQIEEYECAADLADDSKCHDQPCAVIDHVPSMITKCHDNDEPCAVNDLLPPDDDGRILECGKCRWSKIGCRKCNPCLLYTSDAADE